MTSRDDEFREDDLVDDVDAAGGDDGGAEEFAQPAAKKTSLPMMAAIGVGVAAVVGFAGFKVYSTMFPAPRQSTEQMVPAVQPMGMQKVQPVVPMDVPSQPAPVAAAAAAAVGGQLGQPAPLGAGAAPVALPVGAASAPAAPAAIQPLGAAPEAPAAIAPAAIAPAAIAPAPSALGAPVAPVNMEALAALKKAQDSQGKQLDDISARIQRLEARIAELSGRPLPAAASKRSEESVAQVADDEGKARRVAVRKARLKKAQELALKKREELQRLAKLKAAKAEKAKAVKEAEAIQKRRATNVVKSADVLPDAPVAKKPSVPSADLPPTPVVEQPKKQEEQPTVRVTGLRIQAVIPGRVWIADDTGTARSYSVGDAVRAGVVIRAIDAEKGVVTTSAGLIR